MQENRGPEARIRDLTSEVVKQVERLPHYFKQLEAASEMLAAEGLRLHPDTLEALHSRNKNGFWKKTTILFAFVLTLAVVVWAIKM